MVRVRIKSLSSVGFTLVELLMAMTFFSFMMAILSIGVIQIMQLYQADISAKRTQTAARTAMEDITREVRAASTINTATGSHICLEGSQPVDYQQVSNELIKKTGGTSCGDLAGATTSKLIETSSANNNLQLRQFSVTLIKTGTTDSSVAVSMLVSTGADDLLSGDACIPGITGSAYCATTQFSNTVSLRGDSGG